MTISRCEQRRSAVAAAVLIVSLVIASPACKRHKRVMVRTVEEAPAMASVVATADPNVASQLVSGFYGVEQNAWRWTAGRFSVILRPPRTASNKGATLELKFAIPDVAIKKMRGVSLSAYVNGTALAPETYTQAGQFTYTRDIPANLLPAKCRAWIFRSTKPSHPAPRTSANWELWCL